MTDRGGGGGKGGGVKGGREKMDISKKKNISIRKIVNRLGQVDNATSYRQTVK